MPGIADALCPLVCLLLQLSCAALSKPGPSVWCRNELPEHLQQPDRVPLAPDGFEDEERELEVTYDV